MLDANQGVMMPAFSPDGTKLAVVQSGFSADNVIPTAAGVGGATEFIGFLDFNEANAKFGSTFHKLVDGTSAVFNATGHGLAYPTFTPDSKGMAFHAGQLTTGCGGDANHPGRTCDDNTPDDGNLFAMSLTGAPVRMAAANDPPIAAELNASVEPTFNPEPRGGYSWVVFTSMRQWGNQPWPGGTPAGHVNAKRRLWIAAVDPVIGTVDPSHPAIYLEGQEDTPNMRGFWALAACIATPAPGVTSAQCNNGFECCSGFCQNQKCVDVTKVACSGVGGACSAGTDCCNSGAVTCSANVCTATAPR